jgi:hypothetical protein
MEDNHLIPYSVHLRKDIHAKLKAAAGERKASGLVRDAITLIIEGDDKFDGGYKKGLRDAIDVINKNDKASNIAFNGETVAEGLIVQIEKLIPKEKPNGKKKG